MPAVLSVHISGTVCNTSLPHPKRLCENQEELQLLDAGARPTKYTIISAADPNELNVHSQASKLKGICTPCTVLLCRAVCLCLHACEAVYKSHEQGNVECMRL